MAGKFGTKETVDCLYLAKVVTLCILREVKKDGFQATDMAAFLKSAEFEVAVKAAVDGVQGVPAELTELDLLDDLALGKYLYGMVTDIVGEMRALKAKA